VARQYCDELGKQDNCQVAVTLSIANHVASLPVLSAVFAEGVGERSQTSAQGRSS
jgi:SRSO17 transposase